MFFKLRALKRDKHICTSSITFVKKNIPEIIFPTNLKYDNDWQGLIDLAKTKSKFVYIRKKLVGYRLGDNKVCEEKQEEDKMILQNLYPKWYYEKVILRRFK